MAGPLRMCLPPSSMQEQWEQIARREGPRIFLCPPATLETLDPFFTPVSSMELHGGSGGQLSTARAWERGLG